MKTYRPSFVADPAVRREFASIHQAAQRADPFTELQVLYAEPEKLSPGMLVYASGTTFDPGSGEGIYRRNLSNTAWVFLG